MTIIRNGRVIRGGVIEAAGEVAFENGKIVPVPADASGAEIIDAAGRYVAPGFVDIHTHGGGGSDFLDNTVEAFLTAARLHASHRDLRYAGRDGRHPCRQQTGVRGQH